MALRLGGGLRLTKVKSSFLQQVLIGREMSKSKKKSESGVVATKLMPLYCFEVLDNALQGLSHPKYPEGLGSDPSYGLWGVSVLLKVRQFRILWCQKLTYRYMFLCEKACCL